ncbi:acyl-CoA N-acyltransferase [Syncephalis pseudoplumigaleata]|uniref:Acyl-CoA N-acyltransferase n=1 Tax=Syncephalis pseudoplumigaleata TaxID=1712513 RepID=A0A4P9YZJ8_9FUNG|nr:acyl-CoA N-acyltransferase [Syncephalis pseudoplumigaleata]|eukprot:RKP25375.1 acyl-CoA N-acyltransferase [Syncephalis pseudoplumigaleata]
MDVDACAAGLTRCRIQAENAAGRGASVERRSSRLLIRCISIGLRADGLGVTGSGSKHEYTYQSWTTEVHLVSGERITKQALVERLTTRAPPTLIAELVSTEPGATGQPLVVGTVEVTVSDKMGEPSASPADVQPHSDEGAAGPYGVIGLLAVDPKHQSRRIGSSLVRAAEEYARDQMNLSRVGVWVIKQRTDIIRWYERMGFTDTGREMAFIWEDLAIDKTTRFRIFLKSVDGDAAAEQ